MGYHRHLQLLTNYILKITQVKLMLLAEQIEIVYIVMLAAVTLLNLDIQDFMLCAHQEETMSKEIGIQNGWVSTSDALMKMVPSRLLAYLSFLLLLLCIYHFELKVIFVNHN